MGFTPLYPMLESFILVSHGIGSTVGCLITSTSCISSAHIMYYFSTWTPCAELSFVNSLNPQSLLKQTVVHFADPNCGLLMHQFKQVLGEFQTENIGHHTKSFQKGIYCVILHL